LPYFISGAREDKPVFLAVLTPTDSREVSPDAALVRCLLRQDVNAFEQLYDRHSRAVYSLVLRILQHASTAEEVVQDIFLQLWRNASRYDPARGPFLPWLLTLARNRALDQLRLKSERQRRREGQTDELPPVSSSPDYESALDEKRQGDRVRALMSALNPRQRRAIELAYFEGLSHTEIAESLQEPLGTVKSWIRNGLLRLKEGLQATS
jgi:RNA polymerase sigma-70 factor, ECF subfamily